MSTYGYERPTTPRIDALAQKGIRFTGYVSNSSWTRPSFTTIITGLPKREHGVELAKRDVDRDITTIAEYFRAAGYRTAGFVGNPLVRGVWGFNQGYQVYGDTASMNKAFPPDGRVAQLAVDWLKKNADAPFFLKIFFTAPHAPYRPLDSAKHFVNTVERGTVVEYPFREYAQPMPRADHEKTVAAYDDEVRYADAQVGRIVDALQELGALSRTAIVVTADHGEVFGDHNCWQHTYHMWEAALRVPFVLYLPFSETTGLRDDRPFTHVDILPTLLDIAGIAPDGLRPAGLSIVDALARNTDLSDRILLSQYNAHGIRRQAVRQGAFKLVHHHPVSADALAHLNSLHEDIPHEDPADLKTLATDGERWEFFDLAADPGEQRSLHTTMKEAPAYPALMDALQRELEGDDENSALSKELLEALEAAGYIMHDSP